MERIRYTKQDEQGRYYIEAVNGKLESDKYGHVYGRAIDSFAELENADVVAVVRCKECENYQPNPYSSDNEMVCKCWADWTYPDPDDFCSYGERKEKMSELKPCPFCGGKAKVKVCDGSGSYRADIGTEVLHGRKLTHCLIWCERCMVRTQAYITRRGAFNAWNRRSDNDR